MGQCRHCPLIERIIMWIKLALSFGGHPVRPLFCWLLLCVIFNILLALPIFRRKLREMISVRWQTSLLILIWGIHLFLLFKSTIALWEFIEDARVNLDGKEAAFRTMLVSKVMLEMFILSTFLLIADSLLFAVNDRGMAHR